MKKTLVCIVGPTAIGKTAVAIRMAQALNTVILSADSRQFYREMTIGTAKPRPEELSAVPHYFIDNLSIFDEYSAGDFEREALAVLDGLFARQDTVILVGGSGLFVDAVCRGLDDLPKPLPGVRDRLNALYREKGMTFLQEQLKHVDPQYFEETDIHNSQRVIRALEVYESSGKPFSSFRQHNPAKRPFEIVRVGLNTARDQLYQRINSRVDSMMKAGLLEEAQGLMPYRNSPPLLTVGYAELFAYFGGDYTLTEAVNKIKQNTRRFAKRQLTWFKRHQDTKWFEPDEDRAILEYIRQTTNQVS